MKPHDGIIFFTRRRNNRVFSFSAFLSLPCENAMSKEDTKKRGCLGTCKPRREVALETDHVRSKPLDFLVSRTVRNAFLFLSHLHAQSLSCVPVFATPWMIAYQAPLFMALTWQEYWWQLSFPTPGDLPNPGMEPIPPTSSALAGGFFITGPPGKPFQVISLWNFAMERILD